LKPYIEGFPYSSLRLDYQSKILYYFKDDAIRQFKYLPINGDMDFENGNPVSDIDFSKRNVFDVQFNPNDSCFYLNGDERNDEILNLYKIPLNNGKIQKLTDVPYIFGYNFNKDKDRIAYVARLGTKEDQLGELRIIDVRTGEEKIILRDNPEMRFTWGKPSFSPDNIFFVLNALKNTDRAFGNLLLIDINERTIKNVTNSNIERRAPTLTVKWLNDFEFIYASNETDINNLFKYNLQNGKTTLLTNLSEDVTSYDIITVNGDTKIFLTSSNPLNTNLYLLDVDGKLIKHHNTNINYTILDSDGNKCMLLGSSASVKFIMEEVTITEEEFVFEVVYDLPEELKRKIYHAEIEKIDYPTFDIDEKTGKQRLIHAFVYKPKNPLPKDQQIVLVQAFYGGSNSFHFRNQMLAEAGIVVISPAPRGSDGWGYDYKALNDKDLGGNEIIDIIYAGKYANERFGVPPERIGVYGGSHGGYAVMRLLTFPGEVNGFKTNFNWGFGLSHAGFSDILHFYQTSNIPDWVLLEAGDPATESEKLRERSPINRASDMMGKILLTHGTNDNRVPVEGSIWFADSLKKYGIPHKLVLFEGQGHDVKGIENNMNYYKIWFEFLEELIPRNL
jgi:dipeptidyl aminopeptidase/acylaminoacyl peptidase